VTIVSSAGHTTLFDAAKTDAAAVGERSQNGLIFVLALLLTIIGIYPSSPVLMLLMGATPAVGYSVYCVFAGGILLLAANAGAAQGVAGRHTKILKVILLSLGGLMVLKIVMNYAAIAVRDLMVIFLGWFLLRLSTSQLTALLRNIVYIVAAIMFASLVALLISYYFGLSSYAAWNIDYLHYLSPTNPVISRRNDGVYTSYYMPYYLAIIPVYDAQLSVAFGLAPFQRQDFIFTEWSYLSYFIAPLAFYLWGDKKAALRIPIALLFALAFFMAFSVWGVVTVAAILIGTAFVKLTGSPKMTILIGALALAAGVAYEGVTGLIGLLGGDKLDQFYVFFGDKVDLTHLITPFGVDTSSYVAGADVRVYGMVNAIFVYGIVGIVAYIILAAMVVGLTIRVLGNVAMPNLLHKAAIALLLTFILGQKLAYFVPLFLLFYAILVAKLLDDLNPAMGNASSPMAARSQDR
jgi:hypothetical protein